MDEHVDVACAGRGRRGDIHPTRPVRRRVRSGSGQGCRRWSSGRRSPGTPRFDRPCGGRPWPPRETRRRRIRRRRMRRVAGRRMSSSRAGSAAGSGKRGGDIIRASTLSASAPSSCGGSRKVTCESGWSPLRKKGKSLNVVPVQVGQEDAPLERPSFEEGRDLAEPGARVEQEGGHGRARGRVSSSSESATHDVWPP